MEFAKDKEFVADFVHRTKENISHGHHPNEITQLINSLIGLLVLPKERYYRNIRNDMIDRILLTHLRQGVDIPTAACNHSLKYIVRRMRNAIAHFNIECKVDKHTRQIDHIVFKDFDDGNISKNPDFQITIRNDILERFVYEFSDAVSKSITSSDEKTE